MTKKKGSASWAFFISLDYGLRLILAGLWVIACSPLLFVLWFIIKVETYNCVSDIVELVYWEILPFDV